MAIPASALSTIRCSPRSSHGRRGISCDSGVLADSTKLVALATMEPAELNNAEQSP